MSIASAGGRRHADRSWPNDHKRDAAADAGLEGVGGRRFRRGWGCGGSADLVGRPTGGDGISAPRNARVHPSGPRHDTDRGGRGRCDPSSDAVHLCGRWADAYLDCQWVRANAGLVTRRCADRLFLGDRDRSRRLELQPLLPRVGRQHALAPHNLSAARMPSGTLTHRGLLTVRGSPIDSPRPPLRGASRIRALGGRRTAPGWSSFAGETGAVTCMRSVLTARDHGG
jgi:hypothetical protein